MSAAQAALRGTYRRDRHGDLPPHVPPLRGLPRPPATAQALAPPVACLTGDDAPPELSPAARELWARLVVARPTETLFAMTLAVYCEAAAAWGRATRHIQLGDLVRVGNRPAPNPYLKLRADAERTLLHAAQCLGWTPTVANHDLRPEAPPSRLQQFLAARARRR